MSDPWKRKEVIGDCTLYLGDCLEVLPTLGKVDAVVTDPPYGIGFKYETHADDAEAYPEMMRAVVAEVERLRSGGPAVFWQGMLNASRWHEWFPPGFRIYAACKGFVQSRPIPVQYSWDPVIFWGTPDIEPCVWRKDWSIQRLAPFGAGRPKIAHPCPRPFEQVCQVLETFTLSGQVVLDPFLGSGTTLAACAKLGRRGVGIELDPGYFDIACRRIEEAYRQPDMFVEPSAAWKQESML